MKPTLVIVDDVLAVRKKLFDELENDFEIVAEASDGLEAVEICRLYEPDLVLMDVVMPKMSGIDATRQVLTGAHKAPKVIILSGMKDEGVVLQALEAGASDYLFKPVDGEKLRQVLQGFVAKA